ncbi:MAG: OmpA family protein [Flavobacteriales bacterium]|nr:OmpA family protein [Flavobacteriales bacterium]
MGLYSIPHQYIIKQILTNKITTFEWVYFETNKWNINRAGEHELISLYNYLDTRSHLQVRIMAHTDSDGTYSSNMTLSKNRANEVVKFLISLELPENRINSEHYGESRPTLANSTEANKAVNRRTEYLLY